MPRRAAIAFTLLLVFTLGAHAQDPAHQHDTVSRPWQWGVEGAAFVGYNYQYRKFTDFDEFESQNWLMTTLARSFSAASHLRVDAMRSEEHTSELQSQSNLVCRLLLEKKNRRRQSQRGR